MFTTLGGFKQGRHFGKTEQLVSVRRSWSEVIKREGAQKVNKVIKKLCKNKLE